MKSFWMKLILVGLFGFSMLPQAYAWDKGIYLTQYTLEKTDKLKHFIEEAKATGINTFVVDREYKSSHYAKNIAMLKEAGFKVVARVIVFPDGGKPEHVLSEAYWAQRYAQMDAAIKAGVDAIQLDYIRYSSKMPANPKHAHDIYKIIKYYKEKLAARNIPMQIDIFGEVSYYPSMHIGQDIQLFADSVDSVNPMVYPSHFWPYEKYSVEPYKTVNNSLNALAEQFEDKPPFKIHAFIEGTNYHYLKKTTDAQKQKYLLAEIRAVEDAKNAAGWYVWSANNQYDNLFAVLRNNKTKAADPLTPMKVVMEDPKTGENKFVDAKSAQAQAMEKNSEAAEKIDSAIKKETKKTETKKSKWFSWF
jgi:hypothetical protein